MNIHMTNIEMALNLLTCIVVGTAMVIILKRFLKRLKDIEIERWGDGAHFHQDDSVFSVLKWIFGKKKKLIEGGEKKKK